MEDTVDLAWRRQIVCVAGVHLSTAARPGSSGLREGGRGRHERLSGGGGGAEVVLLGIAVVVVLAVAPYRAPYTCPIGSSAPVPLNMPLSCYLTHYICTPRRAPIPMYCFMHGLGRGEEDTSPPFARLPPPPPLPNHSSPILSDNTDRDQPGVPLLLSMLSTPFTYDSGASERGTRKESGQVVERPSI